MTTYNLKVTGHEPIYSNDHLAGYISLAKNDAFRVLEKKLIESGEADEYFNNYEETPYPKLWEEPKMVAADYAVEEWFNDNYDVAADHSFARSFYNSTISESDIEVTFDRDYYVELDGDTFIAHVDDTWDELYKNAEAIQLLKENSKLGQKYVDMYFADYASKEFKQAFENIIKDKYEEEFDDNIDEYADWSPYAKAGFHSNLDALVSNLNINWKAEVSLDELYSASLKQYIESSKRENADQEKVPLSAQYKQIEDFMKSLLDLLPENERSKVEEQIYYDTRKNSLQFMLTVNGSSPHFFIFYDKSGMGAAQCWITDGYLSGTVYHDGDFKPFAVHADAEKFVGSLESFVNSLVDTYDLNKFPPQQ